MIHTRKIIQRIKKREKKRRILKSIRTMKRRTIAYISVFMTIVMLITILGPIQMNGLFRRAKAADFINYPNPFSSQAEFLNALKISGVSATSQNRYSVNYTTYIKYHIIVYGSSTDVPNNPTSSGQPMYIGYTYDGRAFNNPDYPPDGNAGGLLPTQWNFVSMGNEYSSWRYLTNKVQHDFMVNQMLIGWNNTDSNFKVNSSYLGQNKAELEYPSSLMTQGYVKVHRKASDGNIYYATFNTPAMGDPGLKGTISSPATYTLKSDQNQITIPITATASVTPNSVFTASMIRSLSIMDKSTDKSLANTSGNPNVSTTQNIVIDRDHYGPGTYTIPVNYTANFSSIFDTSPDFASIPLTTTMTVVVQPQQATGVSVNSTTTVNPASAQYSGSDINVNVNVNASLVNYTDASNISGWTFTVTPRGGFAPPQTVNVSNSALSASNTFSVTIPKGLITQNSQDFYFDTTATAHFKSQYADISGSSWGKTNVWKSGPPIADFTYSPDSPVVGGPFYIFDASHASDGATIVERHWSIIDAYGNNIIENYPLGPNQINWNFSFPYVGGYTINLTVVDSSGQSASASKSVTVGPALPYPVMNVKGDLKENRKVILDSTWSFSSDLSPIISSEWSITPVSSGLTASDIKIRTSSPINQREVMFDKPGDYKVGLRVSNSRTTSDWTYQTITIKPDVAPVANLYLDQDYYRNPFDNNRMQILPGNLSYSADGDLLVGTTWGYKFDSTNTYDSNNNPVFTASSFTPATLDSNGYFEVSHLGYYQVQMTVQEGIPADDTLGEFLIGTSTVNINGVTYYLGKASSTTNVTNMDNEKPTVDFGVSLKKVADVKVATGNTVNGTNLNSFENTLRTKLASQNISANVQTVDSMANIESAADLARMKKTYITTPTLVPGISNVVDIDSGEAHTVVVTGDGKAYAVGNNKYGQLGLGDHTDRSTFTQIPIADTIVAVVTGDYFTMLLSASGSVYTFGDNFEGQLGNGTYSNDSPTPIKLSLTGIKAMAAGGATAYALDASGAAYGWGFNYRYPFGSSGYSPTTPTKISGSYVMSSIAAGDQNLLMLDSTQKGYIVGNNIYGQLFSTPVMGNADNSSAVTTLTANSQMTGSVDVYAGKDHSFIKKNDSYFYAAGYNYYGQLGLGDNTDRSTPVKINMNLTSIAASDYHTLAIDSSKHVYATGSNTFGELGNGNTTNKNTFTLVPGLSNITKVADGGHSSFAVNSSGNLYAWGDNNFNQLGLPNDNTKPFDYQKLITFNSQKQIVTGQSTYILDSNYDVWVTGLNDHGQLGLGNTTNQYGLVKNSYLHDVVYLAGMNQQYQGPTQYFVKRDGTVWFTGENSWDQDGKYQISYAQYAGYNFTTPQQVPGLTNVAAIEVSLWGSAIVLKKDGTVWTYGYDHYGNLGIGSNYYWGPGTFTQLPINNVIRIQVTQYDMAVLTSDNKIYAWGGNNNGEFDTSTKPLLKPIQIDTGNIGHIVDFALTDLTIAVLDEDGYVYLLGHADIGSGNASGSFVVQGNRYTNSAINLVPGATNIISIKNWSFGQFPALSMLRADGSEIDIGIPSHWCALQPTYGIYNDYVSYPVTVDKVADVSEIAVNYDHSIVKTSNGFLTWGINGTNYSGSISPDGRIGLSQYFYDTWTPITMPSTYLSPKYAEVNVLDDLLDTLSWMDGAQHFLVDINDYNLDYMNLPTTEADVLAGLSTNDAYLMGLGTDSNINQYNSLISMNSGNGAFYSNTDMSAAFSSIGDYIINIFTTVPTTIDQYVLLNQEVDYTTSYSDYENDPQYAEQWQYTQNANYFENSMGTISDNQQWLTSHKDSFDKVGEFDVVFQARDNPVGSENAFDNYRKWSDLPLTKFHLYVHRAPVPLFDIYETMNSTTNNYDVSITDHSYDLDLLSQADHGIKSEIWQYKNINATSWTNGKPTSLPPTGTYLVKLTVTDYQGASESLTKEVVDTPPPPNVIPTSNLTMTKVVMLQGTANVITGASSDSDGSIIGYSWHLDRGTKNGDGSISYGTPIWSNTVPDFSYDTTALGPGIYRVSYSAMDNQGAWSNTLYKYFEVVTNNPPTAAFTVNGTVKLNSTLSSVITDTSSDSDMETIAGTAQDTIVARKWAIRYGTGAWSTYSSLPSTLSAAGYTQYGNYSIALCVQDSVTARNNVLSTYWTPKKLSTEGLDQLTPLWSGDINHVDTWDIQSINVQPDITVSATVIPNPAKQGQKITFTISTTGDVKFITIYFPNEIWSLDTSTPLFLQIPEQDARTDTISYYLPLKTPMTIDSNDNRLRAPYVIQVKGERADGLSQTANVNLDVKGSILDGIKTEIK